MNSKIAKADDEIQKMNSEKRRKGSEDRKVGSEIFDKKTLETLYKLANQGYIELLNGAISTGKEANVLKGLREDNTVVAVKIYRIATSDFRKMHYYIDGDPRFNIRHSNKRQLISSWVNKEYRNLTRLVDGEVNVPKPIVALNNVLIMEFIGNDKEASKTTKINPPKDVEAYLDKLLIELDKFINEANLVHGDLSTFNILNHNENPVIIDVSQSVVKDHIIADELLQRDIVNISNEFKKLGSTRTIEDIKEFIGFKTPDRLIKNETQFLN